MNSCSLRSNYRRCRAMNNKGLITIIRNNFASLTCTVFLRPFIQSGSFAKSLSMKFRNFVISILLNSPKYSSWFSQSGLISHDSPWTLCIFRVWCVRQQSTTLWPMGRSLAMGNVITVVGAPCTNEPHHNRKKIKEKKMENGGSTERKRTIETHIGYIVAFRIGI